VRTYLVRQLVQLAVVIVGISVLAFAILHVIGDPLVLLLPQNAGKEEFERHRKLLGLDQPIYVQYWKFASKAVPVRLRQVLVRGHPRLPPRPRADAADDYLTLAGLGTGLLLALPLGILAALKRHSFVDTSLQRRLFKTGGRLIRHARHFTLQLAESHCRKSLDAAPVRADSRVHRATGVAPDLIAARTGARA
jgi:ABC-type dipeptide/oligopeptide/nickel transport system permease component